MQQMLPQLKNKPAVYVVSPQWFTKKGYSPAAFQQYFNSDQLTSFLRQQEGDIAAQYAAKRLLQLYPTVAMKDNVKKSLLIRNCQILTSNIFVLLVV